MKKGKKKYAKCPSCKAEIHKTAMKVAISEMEKTERLQYNHYKDLKIDIYNSFIDSNFDWACDICLEDAKAIKANPSLQNYSWNPNCAYYDSQLKCRSCNSDFKFGKEEKKYWFEGLKFWIDSVPVHCVNCRREIRQLKLENTMLSDILKKEATDISSNELETVIEIYTKWEKEEQAKYYQAILRKRIVH